MNELAKIAFDAYRVAVGGKTYDGKPIPEFAEVSASVQNGWIAAVNAILAVQHVQVFDVVVQSPEPVLGINIGEHIGTGDKIG